MSIDKSKETESQVSEITKTSVRRNFLKKSAIGLVATSMPAQSVWGACNASGISGGSTSTTTCEMPAMTKSGAINGRSPASWALFLTGTESELRTKLKQMFSAYSSGSDGAVDIKVCDLKSFISNASVKLSDGSGTIPYKKVNISEALVSGSDEDKVMAAVYLNTRFRFYDLPPEFTNAREFAEHIWGVLNINNLGLTAVTNSFVPDTSNHVGVTAKSIPSGGSC
jgi:hypothetical protein